MFSDSDDESAPDSSDVRPSEVVLDTEAEVACPYCGEKLVICCRPWRVRLTYDETGAAEVWVEGAQ